MNLGEMRAEVRALTDRPSTKRYTNAEIDSWINRGQLRIARNTQSNQEVAYAVSVVGQREYEITNREDAEDTLGITTVTYDGTEIGPGVRFEDFARANPNWESDGNATPLRWYRRGRYLGLDPAPDTVAKQIKIWYWAEPTPLTADANVSELPEVLHDAIVFYAVWQLEKKNRELPMIARARADFFEELARATADYDEIHDAGVIDQMGSFLRVRTESSRSHLPDNYGIL